MAGTPVTPVTLGVGGGTDGLGVALTEGDATRLADGVATAIADGPPVGPGVDAADGASRPGTMIATATTSTAEAASAPTGAHLGRWRAVGRSRTSPPRTRRGAIPRSSSAVRVDPSGTLVASGSNTSTSARRTASA